MSKSSLLIIFCSLLIKLSVAEAPLSVNHWVVWDIGQGQWVTHVLTDECIHYDVGGEIGRFKWVQKSLISQCSDKKNFILLSHWDYDHFMHIPQLIKAIRDVCWLQQPKLFGKMNKSMAQVLSLKIPFCTNSPSVEISSWAPLVAKTSNDSSRVSFDQGFLLPGDSTVREEKIWSTALLRVRDTKVLVLGHHGSRTSTSTLLLNHLPNIKMAVASARFKKYHHPHKDTVLRLAKNKTPILKTEDWGSIWFF